MKNLFIHLRLHSNFSLAEGMLSFDDLSNFCVKNNQPAIAITDTNNLFGALEFSLKMISNGIQPIIGIQLNISLNGKDNKTILRGTEIGFIFQSHRLFQEFSAIENVMLPQLIMGKSKVVAEKKAKELLSILGLRNRLEFRPAKLSGGEAQRVAIARALSNSPNLILADEPTGNLDTISAKNVFEILYKLVKSLDISCIFATHNNDLAKLMDRKIVLKNGSVCNE